MSKKYVLSSVVATLLLLLCLTAPVFACSNCEFGDYIERDSYSYQGEQYFDMFQLAKLQAQMQLCLIMHIVNNNTSDLTEALELLELRNVIVPFTTPCRSGGGVPCSFTVWEFLGILFAHSPDCPNGACGFVRSYISTCNWGCGRWDSRVGPLTIINCRPV